VFPSETFYNSPNNGLRNAIFSGERVHSHYARNVPFSYLSNGSVGQLGIPTLFASGMVPDYPECLLSPKSY
jgi:hypothetical protein